MTRLNWAHFVRKCSVAALLLAATATASAGGYLVQQANGLPKKWANSITLRCDLGALSPIVNNAAAKALVTNAVSRWTTAQIAESALSISIGADLPNDNANGNATAPDYNNGLCDGINPVVYDA